MTKQDYELIASTVWDARRVAKQAGKYTPEAKAVIDDLVGVMVAEFKRRNPNFRADLFVKACELS